MTIEFKIANPDDAETISNLVVKLTEEICALTSASHFDIDLIGTVNRCNELIASSHYCAIIGYISGNPVAVLTFTELYALYAGGKVGKVPESLV